MRIYKSLIAACALLMQPAMAAVEVVSPEAWTLYRGTSIVQPRVAHPTKDACQKAAPSKDVIYQCRASETFIVRADAPPPPPPAPTCTTPQPAPETRTQSCPSGTTGTWSQSRAFVAAPHPTCWVPGSSWAPATAPAGACTPVVTPPPPPPPPPVSGANAGVPQGATETLVATTAMVGTRTFHVRSLADAQAVQWGSLACGDVVNIHPGTYPIKVGLRAQCPASNPVTINGVSDAAGNKPVISGSGATTMPGSANVFSNTPAYGESLGIFVIKRGTSDSYNGPKPSGIVIQGIALTGAANGQTYRALNGSTQTFGDAANIYVHVGSDITIQNVTAQDGAFCLFVMAKDGSLSQAGERITLRNSRMSGCGVVGAYYQHNVYMQSSSPLVEGNYFGKVKSGSQGSSYKSRSSGEIFRANYVVASARAIDFVHSEEQSSGIAARPDYGTDWVYGNTIISDGPEAIHFGGDNYGEQEGGALFTPSIPYRKTLYFWNNKVTLEANSAAYRVNVFDLSLRDTVAHVWGNTFAFSGGRSDGEFSWLQWAGQLRLGTNTVTGKQPANARSDANAAMYSITTGNPVPALPAGL